MTEKDIFAEIGNLPELSERQKYFLTKIFGKRITRTIDLRYSFNDGNLLKAVYSATHYRYSIWKSNRLSDLKLWALNRFFSDYVESTNDLLDNRRLVLNYLEDQELVEDFNRWYEDFNNGNKVDGSILDNADYLPAECISD